MVESQVRNNADKEYRCYGCGETDRDKFYPYMASRCKKCLCIRVKEWRKAHPEWKKRQNSYYKKWYADGGRKNLTEFRCPKCGETDPAKFYPNRRVCKPCQNKVAAAWRKSNPWYAQYQKEWWKKRRGKV